MVRSEEERIANSVQAANWRGGREAPRVQEASSEGLDPTSHQKFSVDQRSALRPVSQFRDGAFSQEGTDVDPGRRRKCISSQAPTQELCAEDHVSSFGGEDPPQSTGHTLMDSLGVGRL